MFVRSKPHLHLVVALEYSFLHSTILGEQNCTIFEKIVQYLQGFCDLHLQPEDILTICILNLNGEQFNQKQFGKHIHRKTQLDSYFEQLKKKPKPESIENFSLDETFTCLQNCDENVNHEMVGIIVCSSNNYSPFGSDIAELQQLGEDDEEVLVKVNVIDFSEMAENPLKLDSWCLGFSYYPISNTKTQLSCTMARTLNHLVKPVIPNHVFVFDLEAVTEMPRSDMQLVLTYFGTLGYSVCFPSRVLQELEGLKNRKDLSAHVKAQQRMINLLGSLRYTEDFISVQNFIKMYSNGLVGSNEEIAMASRWIKDNTGANVTIVTGYQSFCNYFSVGHGIQTITAKTLLEHVVESKINVRLK